MISRITATTSRNDDDTRIDVWMRERGALRMSPWQGFKDRHLLRCADANGSFVVDVIRLIMDQVQWLLHATPLDRAESREVARRQRRGN